MKLRYAIVTAVLAFFAGAALTAALFTDVPGRWVKAPSPEVHVLMTRQPISQWTVIRNPREMFDIKSIPAAAAPHEFIAPEHIDEIKDRRLKYRLDAGVCLTEDHLRKQTEPERFTKPATGNRVMAVNIVGLRKEKGSTKHGVAGSRADITHTLNGISTVILDNILVLGIDLSVIRDAHWQDSTSATVTVQLENEEQVSKLSAARNRGALSLFVHGQNDD